MKNMRSNGPTRLAKKLWALLSIWSNFTPTQSKRIKWLRTENYHVLTFCLLVSAMDVTKGFLWKSHGNLKTVKVPHHQNKYLSTSIIFVFQFFCLFCLCKANGYVCGAPWVEPCPNKLGDQCHGTIQTGPHAGKTLPNNDKCCGEGFKCKKLKKGYSVCLTTEL